MFSHCIRCFTPCQMLYIFSSLWFKVLIIFSLSRWLPGNINIQMYSDYLCFSEFFAFCTRKKNSKRNKSVSFNLQDAISKMKLSWIQSLWKLSINQNIENFHLSVKVASVILKQARVYTQLSYTHSTFSLQCFHNIILRRPAKYWVSTSIWGIQSSFQYIIIEK